MYLNTHFLPTDVIRRTMSLKKKYSSGWGKPTIAFYLIIPIIIFGKNSVPFLYLQVMDKNCFGLTKVIYPICVRGILAKIQTGFVSKNAWPRLAGWFQKMAQFVVEEAPKHWARPMWLGESLCCCRFRSLSLSLSVSVIGHGCGKRLSHTWEDCHAKAATCNTCKVSGHFRRMCRREMREVIQEQSDPEYEYELDVVENRKSRSDLWYVQLRVDNKAATFKIDTGAHVYIRVWTRGSRREDWSVLETRKWQS